MSNLHGPDPHSRRLPNNNRADSAAEQATSHSDQGAGNFVAAQPHVEQSDPSDDPATERNVSPFTTEGDTGSDQSLDPLAGSQPQAQGQADVSPGRSSHTISANWRVTAESVRGTSHLKSGAGCQDSHFMATAERGILIGALADGAGSAPQSEVGAALAARVAVQELERWCQLAEPWPESDQQWSPIMVQALDRARLAVESEAAAMGLTPRDLASTLILILATPQLVVAGQIGDGAVVLADTSEKMFAITAPQSGEYLNETTFLVSPNAIEQAQTSVWRGEVRFLAAFSDGLQMLALRMSDGSAHKPFFAPLFRFLEEQTDLAEAGVQLRSFLSSSRITQRADDDLTLMLAQCVR